MVVNNKFINVFSYFISYNFQKMSQIIDLLKVLTHQFVHLFLLVGSFVVGSLGSMLCYVSLTCKCKNSRNIPPHDDIY